MAKRTVLSERKTKAAAAMIGVTLEHVNEQAGLGVAYVSRKWGRDNIELSTINRIANVLGCSACDITEEIDDAPAALPPAPAASATARQQQRAALTPTVGAQMPPTDPTLTPAEAERRAELLRQAAQASDNLRSFGEQLNAKNAGGPDPAIVGKWDVGDLGIKRRDR